MTISVTLADANILISRTLRDYLVCAAGNAWNELAKASEDEFPVRSADLYRPALAAALQVADTKRYASIAQMLATRHRLYDDAGLGDQIDAEIRGIRAATGAGHP